MPRAAKKRVPDPRSSEVDELADDAPTGLTPPRPARSSSTRTSTSRKGTTTATMTSKPRVASTSTAQRGLSSAVTAATAPSTASSSSRLEGYRCQAKPIAGTSTLYETNSVSPAKRRRTAKVPPRDELVSPSSSSTKRRRRTADTDENDRAALKRKVKTEDEFVFVMPDLDEDGEPVVHSDSDARDPMRSSLPPASSPIRPAASSPSPTKPQRSPFRAAPARLHPPRTPSPAHLPPSSSSIDLPEALAERVYALSSPPAPPQQQSEPHTSTTLVEGPASQARERSSSPPFIPRGRGGATLVQLSAAPAPGVGPSTHATPRMTTHAASSQRAPLTSEQKHEVGALLAELELEGMGDGELQEGAFETYVETCVEPVRGGGGARRAGEPGAGEEVVDPDKTLVDMSAGVLGCSDAASSASPSPATVAVNPFADDVPLPTHAPARSTAVFRSPSPPAPAPRPSPSPAPPRAHASPPPVAASPALNRQYHPATPPRRPPGYRLVPLTLDGLASHAREVVAAAASTGAPSAETTYLRSEVRRLAVELEARDKLLGEREAVVRGAQAERERFERERGEWEEERKALVDKVDALREVRRGLLRELREERERADGLDDKVKALEGVGDLSAAGASDVEHDEPVVDVPPVAQPAPDELEGVDAVEPVEET
ncbi:hypothetical protein JCM8208_003764 [Rhodotorula glutinis]